MKINFLFLCFVLLLSTNLSGQSPPELYKYVTSLDPEGRNNFHNSQIKEYQYEGDNLIEEVTKQFSSSGGIANWTSEVYEYNNKNLLSKKTDKRYNRDIDLWITIFWEEYEYDDNDCLLRSFKIDNVGGSQSEIRYENNPSCQWVKKSHFSGQSGTSNFMRGSSIGREYFADGISYKDSTYVFLNNIKRLKSNEEKRFLQNGNLDYTIKFEYLVTNSARKDRFVYDNRNNVIARYIYTQDPINTDWELVGEYFYENEYDENDNLIKISDNINSVQNTVITYEYSCEGIERFKKLIYPSTGRTFLYESFYKGLNECFEIENDLLEIDVFPNPSAGEITIESPVFQSGNTTISIFDISGILLLEKNEVRRGDATIDLNHLPNGIYVVHLMNQEHFVQSKVVIAK